MSYFHKELKIKALHYLFQGHREKKKKDYIYIPLLRGTQYF